MCHQYKLLKSVVNQNGLNLATHLFFPQCGMGNSKGHGKNFYGDDSNFPIILALVIESSQKVYVGPEADTDTVEKYDREF
jgi:hypothetical protein